MDPSQAGRPRTHVFVRDFTTIDDDGRTVVVGMLDREPPQGWVTLWDRHAAHERVMGLRPILSGRTVEVVVHDDETAGHAAIHTVVTLVNLRWSSGGFHELGADDDTDGVSELAHEP
jgi:hypothetical protein